MLKSISKSVKYLFGKSKQPINLIEWRFAVRKGAYNTYKVHITGFIAYPWRLHIQDLASGNEQVTTIEFESNAFIYLIEDLKIMGKLKEKYNKELNTKTHYYKNVVDFVQEVHVFNPSEKLEGKIKYLLCNENQCLDVKEKTFQIELS